ncbi:MAG: preprotein translocase subunit SecG [Pseudomonadota bacterium]
MEQFILIIHLLIAVVLVTLVLMQQSEGGALGMGGGGGGSGSFLTGRGTANLMTRLTAGFGAAFFMTSVILTWLATDTSTPRSRFDTAPPPATNQPAPTPSPGSAPPSGNATPAPAQPANEGLAPLPSLPGGR